MTLDPKTHVSRILSQIEDGEPGPEAAAELLPIVYEELRRIAAGMMGRERAGHTLQPTALVHEAYTRLVDQKRVKWQGRTHFIAIAGQAMRRILIDHARGVNRGKRGGAMQRITLHDAIGPSGNDLSIEQLLELNTALNRLAQVDEREARVVELRCFAGLTVDEVAQALGVSKRTVEGDWTHARAWLRRELATGS